MKIVAIGGGEIGRPGTKIETLQIDRKIIQLSGRNNPKLLFIPTASNDSEGYIQVVEKYFGRKLKCSVATLHLYKGRPSKSMIKRRIMDADIIYVGGGNTLKMLKLWKKIGVDVMLKAAASKGKILAGLSAGAVCWFKYANSDSRKLIDPSADYIKIRGLNFAPLFVVPHFDTEKDRQLSIKRMLRGTRQTAIGIDNCAALVVNDDTFEIITSKDSAAVYKCYWDGRNYRKSKLRAGTTGTLGGLAQRY